VRTTRIEIAHSADLAYAFGTGLTTVAGGVGADANRSASKWLAVFRKRDGAWEIVADAYNEDSDTGTR
jgi:ketosteroid isomerase-like protein